MDDYESNALEQTIFTRGGISTLPDMLNLWTMGCLGEKIVTLSDGSAFSFEWVTATLLDSAVPAAKALSKGDTATLICGDVTGDLLGVSLADCSVK